MSAHQQQYITYRLTYQLARNGSLIGWFILHIYHDRPLLPLKSSCWATPFCHLLQSILPLSSQWRRRLLLAGLVPNHTMPIRGYYRSREKRNVTSGGKRYQIHAHTHAQEKKMNASCRLVVLMIAP
jgi:hypothetical protein